ncbi:MAG: tRNA lysidine(34) synthetase TilS [Puniceicoccaceae bacterium]
MKGGGLEQAIDRIRIRFAPELLPREVLGWLEANEENDPGLAIACSGGADSVFLVLLLLGHFPLRRNRFRLLHYNHRTRAEQNEAEELFVRDLAEELGLRIRVGRRHSEGNSEARLREDRHQFFQQMMAEEETIGLFLGHQKNDVVETFLMRAARGSGVEGMCAPRPLNRQGAFTYLRPLLGLEKETIRQALADCEVRVVEDPSNAEPTYLRNRLRVTVVPVWQKAELERNLVAGVARTRRLLEEDAAALETLAVHFYPARWEADHLLIERAKQAPRAILRRVVRHWIEFSGLGDSVSAALFEEILDKLEETEAGKFSVGGNRWLEVSREGLRITVVAGPEREWTTQLLEPGILWYLPGGCCLGVEPESRPLAEVHQKIAGRELSPDVEAWVDAEEVAALRFRNRRAGDRFHPLGAPGHRRLQDCLIDAGIDIDRRGKLPIIFGGEAVVWVPGFPPGEAFKVHGGTRKVLRLTYKKA